MVVWTGLRKFLAKSKDPSRTFLGSGSMRGQQNSGGEGGMCSMSYLYSSIEINARKRGGAVTMCGDVYYIITVKKNVNVSSLE